jgi:hypothetical protein
MSKVDAVVSATAIVNSSQNTNFCRKLAPVPKDVIRMIRTSQAMLPSSPPILTREYLLLSKVACLLPLVVPTPMLSMVATTTTSGCGTLP